MSTSCCERPLSRRPAEGVLAGVSAGLAHWLGFNLVATRLVLLVLFLLNPLVWIVVYVALAVWLPVEDGSQTSPPPAPPASDPELDTLEARLRQKREDWDRRFQQNDPPE